MQIKIVIELDEDEEIVDPSSSTGLTEEAYDRLMDGLNSFGTIVEGPEVID